MHECLNRPEKDNIVITNTSFLQVYFINRLIIQCALCLVRKPFKVASTEKSILFTTFWLSIEIAQYKHSDRIKK